MNEFPWINQLHAELEYKKRFLMMDGIQSLLIPIIEDQVFEDVWKQIKDHALDASIRGSAPSFLRSIEEVYTDYRKLIERLIQFVKYVQELADRTISTPFLGDAVCIILKNVFSELRKKSYEQRSTEQIIKDALSETGVKITKNQFEALKNVVMHVAKMPCDRQNAAIRRDTIICLRDDMDSLIGNIDKINNHIKRIIEENMIFDFAESMPTDESEFYHG